MGSEMCIRDSDLFVGLRNADDPRFPYPDIGLSAPPFVMNDVIVVGAAHRVGMRPRSKANVKGDIRGFDLHTGALLWTFHTIPERGEVGFESWLDGGIEFTGNAGVWAPLSGDPELGLVYLPVESATGDRYGGDRPGDNLFSDSIVAVDIKPVSVNGTINLPITMFGIGTYLARPFWRIFQMAIGC